jgi:hypothetical protein
MQSGASSWSSSLLTTISSSRENAFSYCQPRIGFRRSASPYDIFPLTSLFIVVYVTHKEITSEIKK